MRYNDAITNQPSEVVNKTLRSTYSLLAMTLFF